MTRSVVAAEAHRELVRESRGRAVQPPTVQGCPIGASTATFRHLRLPVLEFLVRYSRPTLFSAFCTALPQLCLSQTPLTDRVRLRLDTAEAAAVLAILEAKRADGAVTEGVWQHLFSTEGYRRLQAREAALNRAFTDSSFAGFVRSDTLGRRAVELRRALADWQRADLDAAARRVLPYLPMEARIQATVYVVIKPRTNSFVWEVRTDPAIFLYLDPAVAQPKFENTVAHELHHIGYASIIGRMEQALTGFPDSVRPAAEWMDALGEGFAMLAAAGGPAVHPHTVSPPDERARWDQDVANFNQDLKSLERFFLDVIGRRLATPDTVRAVAATFYGVQGPWYTVGWKMAVTIERRFGRDELVRCMVDPRRLLARYNAAAEEYNRGQPDPLATWSPELLRAMGPG